MSRLLVWRAKKRRRVNGREHEWSERRGDELAAMGRDLERPAQERLCSRRAKTHDRARLDELNLGVEPRAAGVDFTGVRLLVNPALAPWLPLEVLDDVGH